MEAMSADSAIARRWAHQLKAPGGHWYGVEYSPYPAPTSEGEEAIVAAVMSGLVALPPKAESSTGCDTCDRRLRCLSHPLPLSKAELPLAPAPKCAPGCSPARPCRTERVCPVFEEEEGINDWILWSHTQVGVASDLPAARPPRFLPLQHAGNAGFAIWGRR